MTYYHKINVEATESLAQAAMEVGVERFVLISTVSVYGLDSEGVINEQSPLNESDDAYTDTNLEAEQVVRRFIDRRLPVIIIQPAQVYGPEDERWT